MARKRRTVTPLTRREEAKWHPLKGSDQRNTPPPPPRREEGKKHHLNGWEELGSTNGTEWEVTQGQGITRDGTGKIRTRKEVCLSFFEKVKERKETRFPRSLCVCRQHPNTFLALLPQSVVEHARIFFFFSMKFPSKRQCRSQLSRTAQFIAKCFTHCLLSLSCFLDNLESFLKQVVRASHCGENHAQIVHPTRSACKTC